MPIVRKTVVQKGAMQTYNIFYESALSFHLLPIDEINRAKSVLIQIFTGNSSRTMVQKLLKEVRVFFPEAIIVGTSTAGEISNEKLTQHKTLISITTFKKTRLSSFSVDAVTPENSMEAGEILAEKLAKKDTALLMLFTEGLYVNPDDFIKGVFKTAPDIPVCGGVAADNGKFFETFVIHGEKILSKGAVGVALNGKQLNVKTGYMSEWETVGSEFKISRAVKNRVYEINGQNAVDFCRHYLGEEYIEHLPRTGFEISLVFEHEGCILNRNAVTVTQDKALVFTGNVPEGAQCKFGYLDRYEIDSVSSCGMKIFDETNIESFFIFCGTGRKRLLKEISAKQVELFADTASVSGFFGYGEFVSKDGKKCLQNQSCSVIGLSEGNSSKTESVCMIFHDQESSEIQRALAHLITTTTKELEERAKQLETLLSYLPAGVVYFDTDLQMTLFNETALTQLGIDKKSESFRDLNRLKDGWIVTLFKETLSQKESIAGGALIETEDGKKYYIRIKTVPLKRDNEVVGAMAMIQSE